MSVFKAFQPIIFTFFSFPLDGCGGFTGDIVDDAVDAAHFVDDADRHAVEDVIGDSRPVGGHEVGRCDAAQRQRVIVRPSVAHDADGAHGGEDREILVHLAVEAGFGHLVAEDEVRLAQRVEFFLCNVADDADGKSRTGERLTLYWLAMDTS
mgnify:CR=1 FL=1